MVAIGDYLGSEYGDLTHSGISMENATPKYSRVSRRIFGMKSLGIAEAARRASSKNDAPIQL
jgi:hypothetical protein